MKLMKFLLIALVLFTGSVNAQLSDFDLDVTKTDETCFGNGSLTFEVSNLTPDATVFYAIYLLPDTDNPIAVITENTLGSLTSGEYRVIATQTLDDESNTQQEDITIDNLIVDFAIEVTSADEACSNGATIVVNALTGELAECEIISGPVTRPLQTENEFNNLPAGTYNVRAFDACGIGKVKTYVLEVLDLDPEISASFYPDVVINSCDSITVSNTVSLEAGSISYPVTIEYNIHVPGEPDTTTSQVYDSGAPSSIEVSEVLPLVDGVSYEITITNGCGDSVTSQPNFVEPNIEAVLSSYKGICGNKFLVLNVSKFMESYTVTFLDAPDGFDPADFVPNPSGPYTEPSVAYGDEDNPVPFGVYEVLVEDECGRTATAQLNVEFEPYIPSVTGRNNGCFSLFGRIRASIEDLEIVFAEITSAPDTYEATLPEDVSDHITSQGVLALNNMPIGFYTLHLIDECGYEYEEEVEVPEFVEQEFGGTSIPSCVEGIGSVSVSSGNGSLTSMQIISAPAGFGEPLPYDVTEFIDTTVGDLFMANLPEGEYVFQGTDVCDLTKTLTITIEGYHPPTDAFEFTPLCGSFSVKVTDDSNGTQGAQYWLQRFDTATQTWGHPQTGVAYTEGSIPDSSNSLQVQNNTPVNNLNYSGDFRIIKYHEGFGDGTQENISCLELLGEFNYTETLTIAGAYTLACAGSPNDVFLDIAGYPTSIRITHMNGAPFVVDNGTNPVFTNLAEGEYTFRAEDNCGNIVIRSFNVQSLPSIATANDVSDMIVCVPQGSGNTFEFDLSQQNAGLLGEQSASLYTITYYTTLQNAEAGTNALSSLYTNVINGQTIYARVEHNQIDICFDVTSFKLFVGEIPQPVINTTGVICDGGTLQLVAENGFASYLWNTGETTRTITVSQPGTYSVTVQRSYGDRFCEGTTSTDVIPSAAPSMLEVSIDDWTDDENVITVLAQGTGDYEYSIDGVTYQDDNHFYDLETGIYQIYVRDKNGCGSKTDEVALLHYPNYFTPNGDGHHERWRIQFSFKEPDLRIDIYDRYGKLLVTFGPNYEGWDGTFNGRPLPSTDYWFVVTRQDGRLHRGHFSLIR